MAVLGAMQSAAASKATAPREVSANSLYVALDEIMDALTGKREFGDSQRPNKRIRPADVPAEYRPVVEAAFGRAGTFETWALERRMRGALDGVMEEDRRLFGLMEGDHRISPKEAEAAGKKDPVAKALIDLAIERSR